MNTRYFNNDVKFYQVIVWNSAFLEKVTILLCALVSWRPQVWVLLEVCTKVPQAPAGCQCCQTLGTGKPPMPLLLKYSEPSCKVFIVYEEYLIT